MLELFLNPVSAIIFAGSFLLGLSLHEATHAWVAYKMGDPTAKMMGRITLNPIKHLDLWWSLILPLAMLIGSGWRIMFGGGKPVPVNPYNFRNFRLGNLLTSVLAPLSNLILAVVLIFVLKLLFMTGLYPKDSIGFVAFYMGATINVLLCAFNLIPCPPLDGWAIVETFLPRELVEKSMRFQQYGFFLLILLIYTGVLGYYIRPIFDVFEKFVYFIMSLGL